MKKYVNAKDVLPKELIAEIQKYVHSADEAKTVGIINRDA